MSYLLIPVVESAVIPPSSWLGDTSSVRGRGAQTPGGLRQSSACVEEAFVSGYCFHDGWG